jgi:hypothetical protein
MRYLLLILLTTTAWAQSFNQSEEGWSFWGDGIGSYDASTGKAQVGSLKLACDYAEQHTTYLKIKKDPGLYRVSFWVRMEDVQEAPQAFWHFYDSGLGTQSVFENLAGHSDWREVSYTLELKRSELEIWFRLKSPGVVWIDDVKIEKANSNQSVSIGTARTWVPLVEAKKQKSSKAKKLFSFSSAEAGHPFSIGRDQSGGGVGEFYSQEYQNFNTAKLNTKDWAQYDHIEMDVYNSSGHFVEFYLTMADHKSSNYWSQLNHKSTLAPGWNHLNFSLSQYVGERGSQRYQRGLELARLNKIFVVADLAKRLGKKHKFLIDNVQLSSSKNISLSEDIKTFDFTSHKAQFDRAFTPVLTRHNYTLKRGFGFINPRFWRVEDSQYVGESLRYSIGVLDGSFRVDLPNGRYRIALVMDKLGMWDPPFWSDRTLSLNGQVVFKESRSTGAEYLKDLLIFENTRPTPKDHPFDLYFSRLFQTIEKDVTVTQGHLTMEFSGDESAISLNRLVISPNNQKFEQSLVNEIALKDRQEIDHLTRLLSTKSVSAAKRVSVIAADLKLHPQVAKTAIAQNISWVSAPGEIAYAVIQVDPKNLSEMNWQAIDLRSKTGAIIPGIKLSQLIPQWTSGDLNHETYQLAGKYLEPINREKISLKPHELTFFLATLKIPVNETGEFNGEVKLTLGSESFSIPISLAVLKAHLPSIDFPVGFFGMDPIPASYFKGKGLEELRRKARFQALELMQEAGMTALSGLPTTPYNSETKSFDTREIDATLKRAHDLGFQKIYSYGGTFPHALLNDSSIPQDKLKDHLKKYFSKKNPEIVHTFSDEASGYSDRLASDIELGQKLRRDYPFMKLAGFSGMKENEATKLHELFDEGFYSSVMQHKLYRYRQQKWGSYNAAPGNWDDPRYTLGPGLFLARAAGLSQYLEWQTTNNYPYLELDGRESDVVLFLPKSNGEIRQTLRFVWAQEGLTIYRKLKLLQNVAPENTWLKKLLRENVFKGERFLERRDFDMEKFKMELQQELKKLM